jgi:TRAP-type C4-dicarboxylate transport system permease large subunit
MMRDVPLQKVFRGCIPFVGVLIVGAAIMTIFPQIALWLPNLMLGD